MGRARPTGALRSLFPLAATCLALLLPPPAASRAFAGGIRADAPPALAAEARDVLEAIDRATPRLAAFYGRPLEGNYELRLVATRAEFVSATEGRAPAWSIGVAIPAERRIVLLSRRAVPGGASTAPVAVHEAVHLWNAEVGGDEVPLWLDEGIAVWLSAEDRGASFWDLARALYGENAFFLDEIAARFPQSESRARLAYYESFTAVQFLIAQYGAAAIPDLLEAIRLYGYEDAVRTTFGLSRDELEYEWYRDLRRRTRWVGLVGDGLPLAGIGSLLLLAAWVRKMILARRKVRAWDAEERLEPGEKEDAVIFESEAEAPDRPGDGGKGSAP